ncbi:hypothetical protein [Alteromonas sp. KUL49]|uniref:hypothetical protein n=1 Tax=Alteromonas sp. KUL49 TaxID=2480798 RepID=UPI00102F076D|nr:hypothetical protein [Alteromonas sp. KUL49]TAP38761.1 hypothetical protein EYS00_15270 [Alteromonas sp. KUL49]
MRPTALIDLAVRIVRTKDRFRRTELFNSCPSHLQDLLRSNITIIVEQFKAKQRAKQNRRSENSYSYKFQPLPAETRKITTALNAKLGNARCAEIRERLRGNNASAR